MKARKIAAIGAASLVVLISAATCAGNDTTQVEPAPNLGAPPTSSAPAVPGQQVDSGAAEQTGRTVYANTELNVRAGPGQDQQVVQTLVQGAQVETTGKSEGGWVELRQPAGWVSGEYLSDTKPAPKPAPTKEPEKKSDSVPAEYRAALQQADTYANDMHMSKQGLYDQLTSEYGGQFPAAAAQYAVDNVKTDWNRNALESAKVYREMGMSSEAIRDQLASEHGGKFTQAQAAYAVKNLP